MTKDNPARPPAARPVAEGDRAPELTEAGIEHYVVDGATEGALDTLVSVVRDVLESSKPHDRVAVAQWLNAIVEGASPDELRGLR